MARCPKCKDWLTMLDNYESGEYKYDFTIDSGGNPQHEGDEFQPDGKTNRYDCPSCGESLFDSEEDATDFLKKVVCDECGKAVGKFDSDAEEVKDVKHSTEINDGSFYFCSEKCLEGFKVKAVERQL